MEKILENGTKVLVFEYIHEWGLNQDMEHYIRGTIIQSEMSEDLSYHGSPWNVINYTVLGEDGYEYFGNYGEHVLGNSFYLTEEDYIHYLNSKLKENDPQKLEEMIKNVRTEGEQEEKKTKKLALSPMMPRNYNSAERAKIREREKEILTK